MKKNDEFYTDDYKIHQTMSCLSKFEGNIYEAGFISQPYIGLICRTKLLQFLNAHAVNDDTVFWPDLT